MKRVNRRWITAAVVVTGMLFGGGLSVADEPKASDLRITPAVTLPFQKYDLCFAGTGVISEVLIKEGQLVKKGDKLMMQDIDLEKAELELLKLDVNNYPIEAAQAKEQAAAAEYKAKENLRKAGGGSDLELEQARAEWEVAKIQIKAAQQELKQKEAKRDKQAMHIEKMTMSAPVAGVVQSIATQVGTNVDPTKPSLTLLENNPIKVQVQVPAIASLQLKVGDAMRVSYDKKTWRDGAVGYLAPQANAGAGMRMVIVEVPNPDNDPSGLQAYVELPEKLMPAITAAATAAATEVK
jgi:RND family efflux transporter MFP subunit